MGFWEKRKQRKAEKMDPYTKEELRLRKLIAEMNPLDDNYDKMQAKLKNNISMQSDSKEAKRRISKADKGGIIMKILSIGGTIGGIVLLGKYERDGNTWTGEKRTIVDSMSRVIGNLFGAKH